VTDQERIEDLEAEMKEVLKRLYDIERRLNRHDRKLDSHTKLHRNEEA